MTQLNKVYILEGRLHDIEISLFVYAEMTGK
jgi:hypothetical protein